MWPNPPIFEFYLFKKHLNHSITKNQKILWIRNGEHSPQFTQQVSLQYQRWLAERFIIAWTFVTYVNYYFKHNFYLIIQQ